MHLPCGKTLKYYPVVSGILVCKNLQLTNVLKHIIQIDKVNIKINVWLFKKNLRKKIHHTKVVNLLINYTHVNLWKWNDNCNYPLLSAYQCMICKTILFSRGITLLNGFLTVDTDWTRVHIYITFYSWANKLHTDNKKKQTNSLTALCKLMVAHNSLIINNIQQ